MDPGSPDGREVPATSHPEKLFQDGMAPGQTQQRFPTELQPPRPLCSRGPSAPAALGGLSHSWTVMGPSPDPGHIPLCQVQSVQPRIQKALPLAGTRTTAFFTKV